MTAWLCFGFCCGSAFRFFWRWRIGAMADHRHHGEGEHHQGYTSMPPMPGSALVISDLKLVFRGLKTVLDRPSMAFGASEITNFSALRVVLPLFENTAIG